MSIASSVIRAKASTDIVCVGLDEDRRFGLKDRRCPRLAIGGVSRKEEPEEEQEERSSS
jgi:hypothetical protein